MPMNVSSLSPVARWEGIARRHGGCKSNPSDVQEGYNMDRTQAASYARVSSEQQADANTVASQIAALQARVAEDGLTLPAERQFVDEGYSGATLIRPALERLRDVIAAGGVDRLYVHSPDRLARKYAYQVLLIDEFQRAGVEVIFLNRELGRTPEDDLLLQVQIGRASCRERV